MSIAAAADLDRIVRREHADPHSLLGAHAHDGGVVVRAFRPAAAAVTAPSGEGRPGRRSSRCTPGGVFEGLIDGAKLPLRYQLEVDYGESGTFTIDDPYSLPADDRRARPAPRSARAATRSCTPSSARTCARSTASRARRSRSGRRARAPCRSSATSTPGTGACTRCARSARPASGSCSCPASAEGSTLQVRDPHAGRRDPPEGRPGRVRRPRCRRRRPRSCTSRSTSGATTSGCASAQATRPLDAPMSIYEVHLGSWRLNPLEGNRSLNYLELADELCGLRRATWASPTSSCCR